MMNQSVNISDVNISDKRKWDEIHFYHPTHHTSFARAPSFSAEAHRIINGIFYAETTLCLLLQLINLFMLHRLRCKTVKQLLETQITFVQMLLVPTNVVLFEWVNKGQTMLMLSIGAGLDLAQVLLFLVVIIDRVLAVKLANHYSQKITRGYMMVVVILIWGVSIFYGAAHIGFVDWNSEYRIQAIFDLVLFMVFISAYSYVVFNVDLAKMTLKQGARTTLTLISQRNVQYDVEMASVIIYFYFSVITTYSVALGFQIRSIHYLFWTFTYLLEAIIHVFGMRKTHKLD